MATALVLVAALVGCGDSVGPGRDGVARESGASENAGHRQKADIALAKLACGEEPKADFAVHSVGLPADSSDRAVARRTRLNGHPAAATRRSPAASRA